MTKENEKAICKNCVYCTIYYCGAHNIPCECSWNLKKTEINETCEHFKEK